MAASVPAPPAVSIAVDTGPAVPRVRITLRGAIDGDEVVDAFIRLYAEHPEAAYYDRLFDFTAYRSGFGQEHLKRIAPAYARANTDPSHPCRTAMVTRDPHFGLWAKSMGFQFKGREHRAFATFEEAERFLGVPLAERRPFLSA